MTPYPILDESGKAREWLRAGRGLVVWESHDIGAGRPDQLTPADHAESCADNCAGLPVKAVLSNFQGAPPVTEAKLAPACRKPHWAYMPAYLYFAESDVFFYLPGRIVQSWNETPQGVKAAHAALAKYPNATRDAPIGRIFTTYTLYRYTMVSAHISPGGVKLDEYNVPLASATPDVPIGVRKVLTDVNFRIGIREWSALVESSK